MKEKEFLARMAEKLGIDGFNPMQRRMLEASAEKRDIILLSPTGSGKTVAFIAPVLKMLRESTGRVQCVVVAPSRELSLQIASVFRALAAGYKVTELYGGHKVEDEVNSLASTPDIIVATPGRLLDHIRRRNVDVLPVRILVLDEFDKTLELGFEEDLRKIINRLKNVSRYILTSATRADVLPEFLKLDNPLEVNFLDDNTKLKKRLTVTGIRTEGNDKLEGLLSLLLHISSESLERTIVFANHRESAERIFEFLKKKGVDCILYHGALDQRQRETSLSLFNNGSRPVLVATDLAARGLDIEGVKNVVHYHQALTPEAFTHRNGRTARVEKEGDVYLLLGPDEEIKPYAALDEEKSLTESKHREMKSGLTTLVISGGKKEKISRGDIVGFLTKDCGVAAGEIGKINVFDHYSLVAVPSRLARDLLVEANAKKLKGARRKFSFA